MQYLTDEDYKKAEENGIYREAAYFRFYTLGWTVERTTTEPLRKSKWAAWEEIATANGISRGTFYDRVKAGLSHEQAATKPLRGKNDKKEIS